MGEAEAFRRAAELTPEPSAARTYQLLAAGVERGVDLGGGLLALSEDIRDARREQLHKDAVRRRAAMLVPDDRDPRSDHVAVHRRAAALDRARPPLSEEKTAMNLSPSVTEAGMTTAELLGNAALGVLALVVIWGLLQTLGVDIVNWMRDASSCM